MYKVEQLSDSIILITDRQFIYNADVCTYTYYNMESKMRTDVLSESQVYEKYYNIPMGEMYDWALKYYLPKVENPYGYIKELLEKSK